jgi:CO/xanthine dehydrogenase Mo-binding subunit
MPDKVNGGGVFGIDLSVPGMLYSSLERPPVYGAKLLSFDKAAAEQVRGVQSVVTIADGAALKQHGKKEWQPTGVLSPWLSCTGRRRAGQRTVQAVITDR